MLGEGAGPSHRRRDADMMTQREVGCGAGINTYVHRFIYILLFVLSSKGQYTNKLYMNLYMYICELNTLAIVRLGHTCRYVC